MTDKQLVTRILAKDQKALNYFYRQYRSKLLAIICQKVEPGVAEEILQDTFMSALSSLAGFNFKSKLSSWLIAISRHETADYYRKQKIKEIVFSRLPFLKKLFSQALSPETAWEEKELKEKIKKTFSGLSEGYGQILRLKYIEGFSVTQISQKLGISYKSCESKLFRARTAFQKSFVQKSNSKYQYLAVNHSA